MLDQLKVSSFLGKSQTGFYVSFSGETTQNDTWSHMEKNDFTGKFKNIKLYTVLWNTDYGIVAYALFCLYMK